MATLALKDTTTIEREVHVNWFTNLVHALQVAVIMKASKARTHDELMTEWNNAWRQVEG